jgi:cyanate permease
MQSATAPPWASSCFRCCYRCFTVLLVGARLRGAPGVLLQPLERSFGWSRSQASLTAAVDIFLYGLMGPFAAALMQSFGIRRVVVLALLVMAAATGGSVLMTQHWQLVATWGVLSGLASSCVTVVLGATIVNRWFVARRGLMMGLLSNASSHPPARVKRQTLPLSAL